MSQKLHVVTGAFGYSGKYIAARLLTEGCRVRTLTNSMQRENPFGGQVEARPLSFNNPDDLVESLRGADVLYNTYWVRFNYSSFKHEEAVQNTLILFEAARKAGLRRIVHISITNPSEDSLDEYFSGKARLEHALQELGVPFTILRPAVLFGKEDILINNIAWTLRHLPVFGLFGDGSYRLQPIYVDDLAALAVEQGRHSENVTIDAIGPETFTYRELVSVIAEIIGVKRPILSMPPALVYAAGWVLGRWMGDVMITWPEIKQLMAGLLWTDSPSSGNTRLTEWAGAHKDTLGVKYASELARRKDRVKAYYDFSNELPEVMQRKGYPQERQMSENTNKVEPHGCIVCGKIYNLLVVYAPSGSMVGCTVISPGGRVVPDALRPLAACTTHSAEEIETALDSHYPSLE